MKHAKWAVLLLLMLSFIAVRAEASEIVDQGYCGENLDWVLTEDGTLTIFGTGEMDDFARMHDSPWRESNLIRHVVIQEGVTSISAEAFWMCQNLTSISFPDGLTSIGDYAFFRCDQSLTSLTLPDGLISIGKSAFSGCDNLTSITLPDELVSIGDTAFYDCAKLTEITLPAELTSIGRYVFLGCSSLERITVKEGSLHFCCDESGVLYNRDRTELIAAPGGIRAYSVPAGVTAIRETAFSGCRNLTAIELPDELLSIGDHAFQHCSGLTELDFPEGLSSIGAAAFESCIGLTELVFPVGLTFIDDYAFMRCFGLDRITFTGNPPATGAHIFAEMTATVFYPADNLFWQENVLMSTGAHITWVPCGADLAIAFGWSGAAEWTLTTDGTLTVYGQGNMKNYDYDDPRPWSDYAGLITAVVIDEGVTGIGECAFKDLPNLKAVTLPENGLRKIGEAAFYGCAGLTEITIPDTIYTVWAYTFKNCSNLTKVKLPSTLIKIDQGAFEGCTALPYIYIPGETEIIGSWSFKGCTALVEAEMTWANAAEIREGAFKNCSALTTIYFPSQIQTFGDSSFYGIGAEVFPVPETVTTIGPWCFARANVKEIIFEGDAPAIGEGAFNQITLTAHYPGSNATWTADIMQNYGGTVTWNAK